MFTALLCVSVALICYELGRLRGLRIALELSRPAQRAALEALDAAETLLQSQASVDSFYVDSNGEAV